MGIFAALDQDSYDRQYSDGYLFRRLGSYLTQQKRRLAVLSAMGRWR